MSKNREPSALAAARQLLLLEPKVGDAQARCVIAYDGFDIFREAVDGLGSYIKRQRYRRAARTVQLAQDRLGDIAHHRCRTVRIECDLRVEIAAGEE